MALITERGINLHLMPIINRNNKDNSENYESKRFGNSTFKAEEGSQWTYDCYRLMDFFASRIREKFNDDCGYYLGRYVNNVNDEWLRENLPFLEKASYNVPVFEKLKKKGNDVGKFLPGAQNYTANSTITAKHMLHHPCLNHLNAANLDRVINIASNYMFSCDWGIMSKSYKKFDYSYKYSNHGNPQTLFEVETIDNNESTDGRHYNREYKFEFNSILGAMFLHNIFSKGYSIIEEPFYSLSKKTNIFYRMNFLCYPNRTVTVNAKKTMSRLGMTTSNKTNINNSLKNIIEELDDNNLLNIINKTKDGDGYLNFNVSNFMLMN